MVAEATDRLAGRMAEKMVMISETSLVVLKESSKVEELVSKKVVQWVYGMAVSKVV